MKWQGVFAAITTPFCSDLSIDRDFLARHVDRLIRAGCSGIVPLGSLGEAATVVRSERSDVIATCLRAAANRVPIVPGIAAASTAEAKQLAQEAEQGGCAGLMVLPPYVYRGDWNETAAHFRAVLRATSLPCMLYNNPIAYGTDVLPEQIAILADEPNLAAVKESSGDVRRVTAIREILSDRLAVYIGVDDLLLEAVQAGAVGWIAGLVNALPEESVRLFDLAVGGKIAEARTLYHWFLPLLRLDTGPKFVQLIKLVQEQLQMGSARVRPPRLELSATERTAAMKLIRDYLVRRPRGPQGMDLAIPITGETTP